MERIAFSDSCTCASLSSERSASFRRSSESGPPFSESLGASDISNNLDAKSKIPSFKKQKSVYPDVPVYDLGTGASDMTEGFVSIVAVALPPVRRNA